MHLAHAGTHKALINGILVSAPQVVPPMMRAGGIPLSLSIIEKNLMQ